MSEQSSFKKHKEPYDEKFTTIPNRLIVSPSLTDSDFRLLTYLFSNSDEWTVYLGYTRKLLGWGKEKMETSIAHLCELGYVKRQLVRQKGKFHHYDFTYHHKPIFIGQSEQLPSGDIQPKAVKPPTVKPTAVNPPLPMPNLPMPNLHGNVGNACLSAEIGDGKALPSVFTPPEPTVSNTMVWIPSVTRKFKRNKEHEERFQFLKANALCDKNLRISEDELSFLSHKYSMKQLQDAANHMVVKSRDEGFEPESRIAFFKHLLENEHCPITAVCQENANIARQFAHEMQWSSLVIKQKYVEDKNFPGKDIPLNMDPMAFFSSLASLHQSLNG